MFFGEFEYKLDEKGRVPLPPRFRGVLKDGVVLSPGAEKCINVYTLVEWKKLAASLTSGPLTPSKMRKLNRAIFATAFTTVMDGQGRVAIPAPLRDYAEIIDDVMVAGANTYLEIWNKANWEEEKAISQDEAWQIIESLAMIAQGHTPVMVGAVIEALAVQPGGRYVDCTLGGGGHAEAILKHSLPGGQLLGIDADPEAIKVARSRLASYRDSVLLVNDNFANLQAVCLKYDFFPVHGILFDLGLSSLQLEDPSRGFSFQTDAPLDMRFSPAQEITAADILNNYTEPKLADLLWTYGEEVHSRKIARRIVGERPLKTTLQLVRAIEAAVGGRKGHIHPATRTFQALRIAVNQELQNLETALKQAANLLGNQGRLVVISYHSLEDRIVKQFMFQESRDCICPPETPACVCGHRARLKLITRKVSKPSEDEIQRNPRARSAKLRAAERILPQDDSYGTVEMENFLAATDARAWRKPALMRKLRMVFSVS